MRLEDGKKISFSLLLTLCVFYLMIIIAENTEGAWTADTYNSTTDTSGIYGVDEFVHTKDDQYAVAYTSSADELWVAHKETTGGSWEYNLVADAYDSYTVAGMRCSSNNTLVIWSNRYETTAGKSYLWIKWPGDDWDDWTGYLIGTNIYGLSLAINNTDNIALAYSVTNFVWCGIFNLTTLSITSADSFGSGTNMRIDVEANQSGDFWLLYGPTSGARYLRDYNKTYAAITKTGYWYYANMVCLPNDRFVVTAYYVFGSTSRYIQYWYQNTHNGGFTSFVIDTAPGTSSWSYPKIGIAQGSLTPWIIAYNSTGGTVMSWHASWNAVQATWKASEEYISTEITFPLGTSSSVWPKESGISWCQPKTGQAFHTMKAGTPNIMQIWTQDISWTSDLTGPGNLPPEFSNETPINGSTGIGMQPWCNVTIVDPEGDSFNITWEENSTGSWVVRQQNITCTNGTFWWQFTQATSYSTRYYWRVSANDGTNNNTTIFHFDLLPNINPVGILIFPLNGSAGIALIPTCRISVSDGNGDNMDISWLENTTGSWVERHEDTGVSDGEQSFSFTQFSSYLTIYYWRINLTDGTANVTYIYHFTTGADNPPSISSPVPSNGSSGVSLSPTCYITVGDQDNMNISWHEWDGEVWIHQQTNMSVPSGTYGWLFSGALSNSTEYWWLVNVTDGTTNVSKMFYFTTLGPTNGEEVTEDVMEWTSSMIMMFLIIVVIIAGTATVIAVFGRMDD